MLGEIKAQTVWLKRSKSLLMGQVKLVAADLLRSQQLRRLPK